MEEYDVHGKQIGLYDALHETSTEFPYNSLLSRLHSETRAGLPGPVIKAIHEEVDLTIDDRL